MIRLHNMRTRPGSKHRVKRLGCGESSGHGKTSGKGHKGQKARSGGSVTLRQKPTQGPRNAEQAAATAETESAAEPKAKRTKKPAAKKKSPAKAAAKKKKPRKS